MGTSRLTSSLLLMALVTACHTKDKAAAERPTVDDNAPCGSSDNECWDSVQATQKVQALMSAPKSAAPAALSFAAVVQSYKPDSSKYRVRYSISRKLNAGESLYVRLRRDTTGANTAVNLVRKKITQKDSADFVVDKIFGKAASYSAQLQYKRNAGALATLQTSRWVTNFPTPIDTTPPGVDSLIVDSAMALLLKPDAAKIDQTDWQAKGIFFQDSLGNLYNKDTVKLAYKCPAAGPTKCPTVQFCTFVVFGDSTIVMRTEDAVKPECGFEYEKFPLVRRANVRPTQQHKADLMCVKYEVDPKGGTITSTICGTPL